MLLDAVARFVVRRGRTVLAATALVTLAAVVMLPRLGFEGDVTAFLTEGTPVGAEFQRLQERYDASEPIMVALRRSDGGTFDEREGLVQLARTRDALAAVDGVAGIGSLLPERLPVVGLPLTPQAVQDLPGALLARLTTGPLSGMLLDDEARVTLLLVRAAGDPVSVVRPLREAPLPAGVEATFAGNPVIFAEVLDLLTWFLLAIPPVVFVLLVAVFALTLGGPRLALLALLPAALGSVWTFGLLAAAGARVDLVTVIVPVFVIVMGSADGLHFVAHLQDAAARGEGPEARTRATLREVGTPMVLTTVSTAIGFLSLVATGVRPLQQLGAFVALGIVFAGVASFVALPALMARLPLGRPRMAFGRRLTGAVTRLAVRRGPAIVVTVVALAFAAAFVPRLQVRTDPLLFFPADHPVRAAFQEVETAFGGATPLFGEFVFDAEAPPEPQLEALRARSRGLEDLSGVRRVLSLADLAPELPAAEAEATLRGERDTPLGPMARPDGLRFMLFPGAYDGDDVAAWRAAAEAAPEVRVLTGTPFLLERLGRDLARAQAASLLTAFVLVTVLLLVTYRHLGRALTALAPLVLTVGVTLGFVAASGIHLNLITAVAASIVVGVGIDYAIHLVAALEYARRAAPGERGWVRQGLAVATRPIVANALGIAIGLSALQVSPLRPHHQVSAILWVAMLVAAVTTLSLIPALQPRHGREAVDAAAEGAKAPA